MSLHPRNRHQGRYDLDQLSQIYPDLKKYIIKSKYGDQTINFFDPDAVKALNKALLALHYGVESWDLPLTALVPPIPGRADYIHYLADIIGEGSARCLDIGVGANCIYPIIGVREYGWEFVGSDISELSLANASKIVDSNECLKGSIELRHQPNPNSIFEGIIGDDEIFDITLCNPPFHDSAESAAAGTRRKLHNLKGRKLKSQPTRSDLNFGGSANELWCEGGELRFITQMIRESREFCKHCRYFTTLVSKESNLVSLRREVASQGAKCRVVEMSQGSKKSRILVWYYS